jgi:capsular polysaccharide biosynthesis protein
MNELNHINKDELDLTDLFKIIWEKKILISIITFIITSSSVMYALSLPNIYQSVAVLAPASNKDSLSSSLSQYSSLASLAGVSLPSGEGSRSVEAIERIKSFDFFSKNFLPYVELENIAAVKTWIPVRNELVYDPKIFDSNSKKWVRNFAYPKKLIPSDQEAFLLYKEILTISQDAKTSFVQIAIEHESPHIAQKWVDLIILNINESMRAEDKKEAEQSIIFLNQSSLKANVQSLKEAISNLQESQLQTLMLASINQDYVFKTLDPAYVAEKKYKPQRTLIVLMGGVFGLILGIILAFILYFKKEYKKT